MEDQEVIDNLTWEDSLLDARIESITYHNEEDDPNTPFVRMRFKARHHADHEFTELVFSQIIEFNFYYVAVDYGYVEDFKFLVTKDGVFYLSLDPDMSEETILETDNDFVKARSVSATFEGFKEPRRGRRKGRSTKSDPAPEKS